MKKTLLLITTLFSVLISFGQVTSISENFNTSCTTGPFVPFGWFLYNAMDFAPSAGEWQCAPTNGRSGTPGASCTGLYGTPSSYHLDTAYLITPQLDLAGYTGNIYLNFDTKTTIYNLGAKLEIVLVTDTTSLKIDTASTFFSALMTPVFSPGDETDWVTHQVDLTPYKSVSFSVYIAFRYTSQAGTNGSKWFLDNINTTTVQLTSGISTYSTNGRQSLSGYSKDGSIVVNSNVQEAGSYQLQVMDMTGRTIYEGAQQLAAGKSNFTIPSLHVTPGMYILKMGNNKGYDIAKVLAW